MFATAGLIKATAREIACVSATLFHHFQNKEQLLTAVITEAIALQSLKETGGSVNLPQTR
ncbi:TetR family transcriptional regulator [Nostoc sp. UHCC 0926]|uniref:TetR family transcriptional regulator n=1 Tax=unclassified Nostoc TaxID=2593658 RepID=UPI0023604A47|nr:TetR family transcriptional regulator [Nostoc sp. UHCC 0926]WDD30245.1 TetR family transcriptional regulator [Nostoc sp. UHCC 0926]